MVKQNDILIRTDFNKDDLINISVLHKIIYEKEFNYNTEFTKYVNEGLDEFYNNYTPDRSRVWICEHNGNLTGCIFLIDRGKEAQLRFFLIDARYRGAGLGVKLMNMFFDFYNKCGYESAYLWTTNEQSRASDIYRKYGFTLSEEKISDRFGKLLTEQRFDYNKFLKEKELSVKIFF